MLTAEADARRIGALAEGLAAGMAPSLAPDFRWRGKPCDPQELASKLAPMARMGLAILETRIVSSSATLEIATLLEVHGGLEPGPGDRLVVVTVQFGVHIISWGLLVDAMAQLRAFFDPAPLLQLIAPVAQANSMS